MKRYALILFFLLSGIIAHGQISQLMDSSWSLIYIEFEGENFDTPQNVFPDIDFYESDGLFYAAGAGVVNGFEGQIEIDEVSSTISFIDYAVTLLECEVAECWYENLYFYDIISNEFETKTFTYEIVYLGNSGQLTLTDTNGNIAFYWDGNMSSPEFNNSPISVSPNPASEYLNIHSLTENPEKIAIYSLSGKLILEQKFEPSISLSGLSNGIYFIEVTSQRGKSVQKFVKK